MKVMNHLLGMFLFDCCLGDGSFPFKNLLTNKLYVRVCERVIHQRKLINGGVGQTGTVNRKNCGVVMDKYLQVWQVVLGPYYRKHRVNIWAMVTPQLDRTPE